MKVLVIGSGGREHALVDALRRSSKVNQIYAAPGNGGIGDMAECVPIKVDDIKGLKDFALKNNIDWTVVGPELPLTLGLIDELQKSGLKTFGVNKDSAQLEGSKNFSKQLLKKYNIPTAAFEVFENEKNALKYVNESSFPIVIKADGLAAGKGVYICQDLEQAQQALAEIFVNRKFGDAGNQVVIEDYLEGKEISAFAFSDGVHVIPLIYAQDYKKIYEGDQGPNTGGMGSYTPVSFMNEDLQNTVLETILKPTIESLKQEGILYQGILYAGLMIDQNDHAKVLEFNVRFGDPEAQVLLPLLDTDIIDIFEAIESKSLDKLNLKWKNKSAVCVVLASQGYPGNYETGFQIIGLEQAASLEGLTVFHAGTKSDNDDIFTAGGRVINVVAAKDTLKEAYDTVYMAVELIQFKNKVFRSDIALREINK